jgi:glycosyltransferase involved in cell wall biosynthesis
MVRRHRPAVVHAHFGTSGLVAALLRKRHRLVVTLHGSDITYGPAFHLSRHWLQYWMSVVAAWRADVVIVQADFMRVRLPQALRARVVVLPQAVGPGFPAPGVARDPELVLFLADANRPVKRAALAEAAVRELSDLPVRLESLDRLHPSDIPAAMARARVGVLTSFREGLPVACREALVSGLPVVAVDLPGTRELAAGIPEGVVLVEPDPHSVAAGLRRLCAATTGQDGEDLSRLLRARTRDLGWDGQHHIARLLACYRGAGCGS